VDKFAALRRRARCKIFAFNQGSAKTSGSSVECNPNACNSSTYNQHIELLSAKSIQIELSIKVHGKSLNEHDAWTATQK
jgi:hypothetical protein